MRIPPEGVKHPLQKKRKFLVGGQPVVPAQVAELGHHLG